MKASSNQTDIEAVRRAALCALGPVRPLGDSAAAEKLFDAKRTHAGYELPPYYLVYFLLVELLGFENLGQSEKVAWSVPVELRGRAFLIEHRKLGLGVFAQNPEVEENEAREIVKHVRRAVKAARAFFGWVAAEAAKGSQINVVNESRSLLERFEYLLGAYQAKSEEATDRKDEVTIKKGKNEFGSWTSSHHVAFRLRSEAHWLALAAIEAFFGWTEHVFIHLAILNGAITTGNQVAELAVADWPAKYKRALDVKDPGNKRFFDALMLIRKELRNHVAHGAFGRNGEAFHFHSGAGAVPVVLPDSHGSRKLGLGGDGYYEDDDALRLIEKFIGHLWSGDRAPAELYVQQSGLPLILTRTLDGSYAEAMTSVDTMRSLIDALNWEFDTAANMDW